MADYPISKEAVQKMLIDLRNSLGNERYISIGITMALHQLDGFPQMDAVPVVRCRECKNTYAPLSLNEGWIFCTFWKKPTRCDGFCHKGEKLDLKED